MQIPLKQPCVQSRYSRELVHNVQVATVGLQVYWEKRNHSFWAFSFHTSPHEKKEGGGGAICGDGRINVIDEYLSWPVAHRPCHIPLPTLIIHKNGARLLGSFNLLEFSTTIKIHTFPLFPCATRVVRNMHIVLM